MSKNTKATKSKAQDKIDQSTYINQIISAKPSKEDANIEAKIDAVHSVTNWPREDIKRVLEDCNFDTQKATSNILDGIAGMPTEDWRVVSKRSVGKDNKEHKPQQSQHHGERRAKRPDYNRNTQNNKEQQNPGEKRVSRTTRNENNQGKENTNTTATNPNASQTSKQNIQPKEQTDHQSKAVVVENKEHPQQVTQTSSPTVQPRASPTSVQQPSPQQATQKAAQSQVNTAASIVQPASHQPISQLSVQQTQTQPPQQSSTAAATGTIPPSYRPSLVWKPKNQDAPASPQVQHNVPQQPPQQQQQLQQTPQQQQQIVQPNINTVSTTPATKQSVAQVQPQQNIERTTQVQPQTVATPTNTTSQNTYSHSALYSASPVILPVNMSSKAQAESLPELNFGTFSLTNNDYDSQYINSSELTAQR